MPGSLSSQPMQKPQPPLRIRQRDLERTGICPQPRVPRLRMPKMLRKPRYRRRLEQVADRQLNIQARTDAADQPHREERMAAKLEEIVLNPYPRHPQHFRKQ